MSSVYVGQGPRMSRHYVGTPGRDPAALPSLIPKARIQTSTPPNFQDPYPSHNTSTQDDTLINSHENLSREPLPSNTATMATEAENRPAFIPLEANPTLMTTLLQKLGVSPALAVHDVYSLTEPELLAFVPRPALALLLVFPVSEAYEAHRAEEDAGREEYAGSGEGEGVVWFRQTIRNACGLMGLLHAVANGPARSFIGMSILFFLRDHCYCSYDARDIHHTHDDVPQNTMMSGQSR